MFLTVILYFIKNYGLFANLPENLETARSMKYDRIFKET